MRCPSTAPGNEMENLHTAAAERSSRPYLTEEEVEALTDAADKAARAEDLREIRMALADLFIAVAKRGPVALDVMLPAAVRYNAASETCKVDRWKFKRQDESLRFHFREAVGINGAVPAVVAMLAASAGTLESIRDIYVRRLAREYAEIQAEGLQRTGLTADEIKASR